MKPPITSSAARLSVFASAALALCVAACDASGHHSPAIDVLGSYFPAWMVCMVSGLALTVVTHLLLIAIKLNGRLQPAPVVYPCLMVIFTTAIWLAFFQN